MVKLNCMYNKSQLLKQLGRNVKAERIRKGYTQEFFAEKLGVTREYVSRIERGQINMSLLKILALADCLETEINNILRF